MTDPAPAGTQPTDRKPTQMHDLITSLLKDLNNITTELPLIHDLSYSKPGRTTATKISQGPRVNPPTNDGNQQAQDCYRLCADRSTTLNLKLSYVAELHRLPPPNLPAGDTLPAVLERLQAARTTLNDLLAYDGLRSDGPMREQMAGHYGTPSVRGCIDDMNTAVRALLPTPTPTELETLKDQPCTNCGERPQAKGRKRCTRCHTHFSRHNTEWRALTQEAV